MNRRPLSTKMFGFLQGALICLTAGCIYGAIEALLSLGAMKTTIATSPFLTIPYRAILGGAFFSQVFFLAWIGLFCAKAILALGLSTFRNRPIASWAVATALVTGIALPFWMFLNRRLPSFRSAESLIGNGIFVATSLFAVFMLVLFLGKVKNFKREPSRKTIPAFIVLEFLFLFLLATASNLPSVPKGTNGKHAASPPNIVLITIDALRADHLSCYGYKKISTPNIDRFAGQGALFESVLSPTSWTLPTFASIFTGVQQQVHGMNRHDVFLNPGFETVAETLQNVGYTTLAVVTNEFLNHPYGLDQGFDRYLFSRDPASYHPFAGLFLYDFLFSRKNQRHSAENMTDRAIALLEQVRSQPYFFWIHYIDPHTPYGDWYIDRFPDYDKDYRGQIGWRFDDVDGIDSGRLQLTPEDKRHIEALYDAEILYTDWQVGRLIDAIDRMPGADNTVVILTSDHGEEFWDHGDVVHGRQIYLESIHVPFMIRYPGKIDSGIRVSSQAGLLDLPPTICELSGVAKPEHYQGKSILRFLKKASEAPVFVSLDKVDPNKNVYNQVGIYDTEFSYISSFKPKKAELLFDTKSDLLQKINIANEKNDELKAMEKLLDEQQKINQSVLSKLQFKRQVNRIEISPEMRKSLRALGYIN